MAMRRGGILMALAAPAVVFLAVFLVLPLGLVLAESGANGGAAFGRVFADPVFWAGARGSLILGTAAPAVSVAAGFAVSLWLARRPARVRMPLLFAISLPLTFSGLIIAYGFILVFGRSGFVTLILARFGADPAVVGGLIFSPLGLGFAYCYYLIPRVVLVMLPVLLNFDSGQLLAAESLGAGRFRVVREILLPQVAPSLVSAFCLCAAVAIGAYGTALALAGTQVNILPLVLYSRISENGTDLPAAAATAILLMAICCAVMAVAEVVTGRTAPRH
jgi:putative spermidine/putrescine transport system permease protein